MNDRERQQLLEQLRRPAGSVGREMPDELTVQGTTIDVTEFVFECKRLDAVPESQRERLEEVKTELRRERLERKQRLEREDLTLAEGEELVDSIHGIDRALNALDGLDEPDIGEARRRKKLEDARELLAVMQ
jgi:hypothetical protein